MHVCREQETLLLYLDRELDAAAALEFEEHLESCRACASFLAQCRRCEDLLESTLAPDQGPQAAGEFVRRVRCRLRPAGGAVLAAAPPVEAARPAARWRRAVATAAGLAAAAALVVAILDRRPDLPAGGAGGAPAAGGGEREALEPRDPAAPPPAAPLALPPPAVAPAERSETRRAFARALEGLGGTLAARDGRLSGAEVAALFAEATREFVEEGWRPEILLATTLKRERGPALPAALELIGRLPRSARLPEVVPSLETLLREGVRPEEVMAALGRIGGSRAEAVLGRQLANPDRREHALAVLAAMGGTGAAREIAAALRAEGSIGDGRPSPFAAAAAAALARLGPEGLDGLLDAFERSGFAQGLVRAISPPPAALRSSLARALPERAGGRLEAAARLAAGLRLEAAIPPLASLARSPPFDPSRAGLIAAIGGPTAVAALVSLHAEPISRRQRDEIAAALAGIFDLHPGELDETLATLLHDGDRAQAELLVEILAQGQSAGACRALGWLLIHQPGLASDAAMGLARIGSRGALDALLAALAAPRLSEPGRVAACAAVYHIGGAAALEKVRVLDPAVPATAGAERGAPPLRPRPGDRSLSPSSFEKLKELVARHARP